MIDKTIGLEESVDCIRDGMTLMIGGFAAIGVPSNVIAVLADSGKKDFTVIADDLSPINRGYFQGASKLVDNRQVKKAILSFMGTNPQVSEQYIKGEMDIEFVPQGTLAERIRAGGVGLGGFYTPTGAGTLAAEGKETKMINGREYLLEFPLRADVAIVKAAKADRFGNATFLYTASNFNPYMAMAADKVILEAEEIVEIGDIDPSDVQLPGIFVDYVVLGKEVRI